MYYYDCISIIVYYDCSRINKLRHATDRVVFTQSVSAIECITIIVLVLYYIILYYCCSSIRLLVYAYYIIIVIVLYELYVSITLTT